MLSTEEKKKIALPVMENPARRNAPGPKGNFLTGSLSEFQNDPVRMLMDLTRDYGDIARQRLGPMVVHYVTHPDGVKYVLQDNNRNYVRGKLYENFKLFFGKGLLTTDGSFWLNHRRIAQPLFHRQNIESMTSAMTDATTDMLERWQVYTGTGEPFDVVPEMMRLVISSLGKLLFSVDIGGAYPKMRPAVAVALKTMMPGTINDFLPEWLPTPHNRRVKWARGVFSEIMDRVIEEHRQGLHGSTDLISMLLAARDEETGKGLSHKEVHDEVMTVFLAGHETTGTALSWAFYLLAKHPAVLRKLEAELDEVLAGRTPTLADLPKLPYNKMVVDEALRLYPPIWLYPRDAVKDDEIGGYHIPAGSSIIVSPYATHRHPAFWENPEAFDPERFLPEKSANRPRFAYFPFGGGQRQCIGNHMALLQMQFTLAMVAQRYHLHVLSGHPVSYGDLLSLQPTHGIKMTLHPRPPSPKERV